MTPTGRTGSVKREGEAAVAHLEEVKWGRNALWTLTPLLFAGVGGLACRSQAPTATTVRLFADDVPLSKLPLSLSIETHGGIGLVLVPRGTDLPTRRSETFSTAADGQRAIEVHVLVGDRTLAAHNSTVGRFSLVEIPTAPAGVPQFAVTFAADSSGLFALSAMDLATGKRQPVSMADPLANPLNQAAVRLMLEQAQEEESLGEYGAAKTTPADLDSVTVYTAKLRQLIDDTRNALKNRTDLAASDREECEDQLRHAERTLQVNSQPQRASVKLNVLKADELVAAFDRLSEAAERCQ